MTALMPQTPMNEDLKARLAFYTSILESTMDVSKLVTIKLLCKYGLIAGFKSVDNINNRGIENFLMKAKEKIVVEVVQIM